MKSMTPDMLLALSNYAIVRFHSSSDEFFVEGLYVGLSRAEKTCDSLNTFMHNMPDGDPYEVVRIDHDR